MRKRNEKYKIINICATLALLFGFALPMTAAEMRLQTSPDVRAGQTFEVSAYVNSQREPINAVEGSVLFQPDVFEYKGVYTGSSIVNFWIELPYEQSQGVIRFSGVTPGGYNGADGFLYRLIFEAKKEGEGTFEFSNARVLANDGLGTQLALIAPSMFLSVGAGQGPVPLAALADIDPPEPFTPEVASEPEMFDGKYFLVFATQDKGTGIDRYEVKEGSRRYVRATSPYVLRNQNRDVPIIVKAVDKSGNERVATLPAKYEGTAITFSYEFGILILIFIAVVAAWFLWRKKITRGYLRK